jgi:nucleotide-binding universal stress UspA family protein
VINLKKILVPTDFSEESRKAQRYGCELADKFSAELHLLHVLPDPAIVGTEGDGFYQLPGNFLEELRADARKQLSELVAPEWEAGKQVVRELREGPPFLNIVRYARENGIDLIVMGTHGRSALSHALMGSVAEKVVRKAGCPVLTVRDPEHEFVMP